jgi:hypothetical protein
MRNDARPIGEDAHAKSPIDAWESVTHERQSPTTNRAAEKDPQRDDHDTEPTMPTGDPALNTKI